METLFLLAVATVVIVLIFDYTNGFHDAANIVATVIASRAMTPAQAVIIVGVFEFLGPLLGGTAVANTIGKFITLDGVAPVLALSVLLCGLIGAIVWNLATWYFGIPSSSSHALVGGLIGAVVVAVGADHVAWGFAELAQGRLTGITKVLAALVLSPLIGFWVGFIIHRLMSTLLRAASPAANSRLRGAQFITAAGLAFSHGANDAQKTMGVITLALIATGSWTNLHAVPFWVKLACAIAIALGTYIGGWRIIRTMGKGLVEVCPPQGLAAEASSASVILASSHLGFALSTTHVATGSILGSGLGRRAAVNWSVAGRMVIAWLITLPSAGIAGAVTWFIGHSVGGLLGALLVFAILLALSGVMYVYSRRSHVDHKNVNDDWVEDVTDRQLPVRTH